MQELLRVVRTSRDDDLLRSEGVPSSGPASATCLHLPLMITGLTNARHRGEREDAGSCTFRKTEVILWKRVLRVVTATGHALTTLRAPMTCGTGSTKERIRLLSAWRESKMHANRGQPEGMCDAMLLRHIQHRFITRRHEGVLYNSEHARCLVVPRSKL